MPKLMRPTPRRRAAFTLLEVVLAMAIGVMLLAALYQAVDLHFRFAKTSRDLVEKSTLARALLNRMNNDVQASLNVADSGRFRMASSSSSGSSGASGATADMTTGATGTTATTSSTNDQVALPLSVQGDATSMTLVISKVPREVWPKNPDDVLPTVCDLRVISYWFIEGVGLAWMENKATTSQDAINQQQQLPSDAQYVIAEEVKSLAFRYFDGTNWSDTWDCTTLGADGVTPIGPPAAIEITLGIPKDINNPNSDDLKYYKHVVAIGPANGITPLPTPTTGSGM